MVCSRRQRLAVVSVEAAFVFPVVIFLILAIVIGSMAVFRYQEVASLAREGSRYASLHGATYQQNTGKTAPVSAAAVRLRRQRNMSIGPMPITPPPIIIETTKPASTTPSRIPQITTTMV